MIKKLINKHTNFFSTDRNFKLFLIAGFFIGTATGIYSTIFNNFLSDTYNLSAQARGMLELPREMPGALIVVVISSLAFLGDIKLFSIGALTAAIGTAGLGLLSPSYAVLIVWMVINNLGVHMLIPLTPVIGMNLSENQNYGMRLGKYAACSLFATILGYAVVWTGFKFMDFTYRFAFLLAAVFFAMGAFFILRIDIKKTISKKNKFIFRKEYTLYYILSIVNGARKQVFLTFAPWVLIQNYDVNPPQFALLGFIVAALSIMTRTIVGKGIDIKGERFVLSLEAVILIIICLGYAFAGNIATPNIALIIIASCYVIDNSMYAVEMARSTYIKKIAVNDNDVSRTLATGTSLDHVIAMSIPFFGGLLWTKYGYEYVFLAAAVIAIINLILSRQIKINAGKTV